MVAILMIPTGYGEEQTILRKWYRNDGDLQSSTLRSFTPALCKKANARDFTGIGSLY